MTVVFDSDFLLLLLHPSIDPPEDPTGLPVDRVSDRIVHLVKELTKQHGRIVIPSPALSECLVSAGANVEAILTAMDRQAAFRIEPFGVREAVEAAASTRVALSRGNKKSGATGMWQCVKTDRQIVAVAKLHSAARVYSNDSDMQNIAGDSGISVVPVWDVPLPPPDDQDLPFSSPS